MGETRPACQFGDHELFFPPEEEQGEYFRLRVSLAKADLRGLPGAAPVRGYALAADERYGVWGGLTPEERARRSPRREVA